MRRPLIAGNWKMNLNRDEGVALATGLAERSDSFGEAEVAVCPPSVGRIASGLSFFIISVTASTVRGSM